ncbi:MAG TPA: NAD-glutamate dehydrogenase [Nevskiaceae bacterium]|nr:NAD-glutamate dehydrogenase [Nevskiaceae bacterium]
MAVMPQEPGVGPGEADALLGEIERGGGTGLPAGFLRRYFESASIEALRQRSPAALAALAAEHGEAMRQRSAGQARVVLRRPDAQQPLAVVQTCVEDMPFLLNTVLMAVREAGAAVEWLVHPILTVQRDAQGRLQGLVESGGLRESWIHIACEPLVDEAAYLALEARLHERLQALQTVVADYPQMLEQARITAVRLLTPAPGLDPAECREAHDLLQWLVDQHFTFLGYAETRSEGGGFEPVNAAALGLARAGAAFADSEALIAPREEMAKYADSGRLVVVTKANQRSPIHQPEIVDVISVKRYAADGRLIGTSRFIGLFASDVYVDRPRTIPLIRRKAEYVMQRARLPEDSHSGRNLREILHNLPRDELFQSSEEELFQLCAGIRALRDLHQLRLFVRRDRYGRFFSCLVYLPRERYSRELRDRAGSELLTVFGGHSLDRSVEFPRGNLARIQYVVRTAPGTELPMPVAEIEQRIQQVTRGWRDQLRERLVETGGVEIAARFADAFPLSYSELTAPEQAAEAVLRLARLSEQQPLLPQLHISEGAIRQLTLYSLGQPLALSDVLPTLENFGLRVLSQDPTELAPRSGPRLWLQLFEIQAPALPAGLSAEALREAFETAFVAVSRGDAENDALNRLVLAAGLAVRQVSALRMLARYLNQVGLPYGSREIERTLAEHPLIARRLLGLFEARFDPAQDAGRRREAEIVHAQALDSLLDAVTSLDADRVLRGCLSVIRAGLRTNYFQPDAEGRPKRWISLKLDPTRIPELPQPRPMFEIWVYAPEVEGVHLRGGKVARGGLRWSDRREDFRTEVLGLMKAQMVKNAVIVPVGAKGGFVVKQPLAEREAYLRQGVACYQTFLRGLLDLTDNLVEDQIVPPPAVVRHDEDDPYLVVAADKGTATFSDIANALSAEYGHWLGDAFASGGSAGYDHKKMGITARGAWESVKRHFREMSPLRDIQREPFTVVGIGDMSGDVFGNGMLLSTQIRLLAAFDHRHIFIDPDPDPATSFAERSRLFALPRSSWEDYDKALISAGGGVWPRSAKHIRVSAAAQRALGLPLTAEGGERSLTPAELMRAILCAPVDLLWNGGIGTYVKSQYQSHAEVRDRANDAIRVNGRELRCQVVGEGGNLGFTQQGRIEYAMAGGPRGPQGVALGGRINTDAIDNSGGVHSSDREVNIKIPLNQLMAQGRLDRARRDPLLVAMTEDIARFVLRDNYVQSACISLLQQDAPARLDEHANLIRTLEREGLLDRAIEALPDEESLKERRSQGQGLTRPELAVLVAYSKISLYGSALKTRMPDDPFFIRDLLANFPPLLVEQQREALAGHRLKREIIATVLSNAVVNRMGIAFAHRMAEDHGMTVASVLEAYAAAHEIYGGDRYWTEIEALDGRLPAARQYRLMQRPIGLLKHATGWMIASRLTERLEVGEIVERYAAPVAALDALLPEVLPAAYREDWQRGRDPLIADGLPESLATRLASTRVLGSALDVADLASEAAVPLELAARVYFGVGERLRLLWLLSGVVGLGVQGKWQALARNHLREDAYRLQRQLAGRVLTAHGGSAAERLEAWLAAHEGEVRLALERLQELQSANALDYAGLTVALRELQRLLG